MLEALSYLKYWDELMAAIICYWCANKVSHMGFDRTACVDIISVSLIGGGAMTHAISPFYGWHIDNNYGDPMLWTGLFMWFAMPHVRKWAIGRGYKRLLRAITKQAL